MSALGLNRKQYSLLSVKERAIYVVRDHLTEWFQTLATDAQIKELERNAPKRNAHRKAPALRRRP